MSGNKNRVLSGECMKVVEFLKAFEKLKYDNDTDLLVLLTSHSHLPVFVDIEDVCNNDDCMNYNEIGIVLRYNGKFEPIE